MNIAETPLTPAVAVASWQPSETSPSVRLIDQTQLPVTVEFVDCATVEAVYDAILTMVVRGAPAIGVAAGYGMVLAAKQAAGDLATLEKLGA